jgi:prepilin-type N-terminal cleavage/methylation domain-containing protein
MKRLAFTLLELVFVIIIIGIMSVLALPNFQSNSLSQVTEQLASHIRYAQHLAMTDDKFDPNNANWWKRRWQIKLTNGKYTIYSDTSENGAYDNGEAAIDPSTGEALANINLVDKFHITNTPTQTIAFDNMGRPYKNLTTQYGGMFASTDVVNINLTHNDGSSTINIAPQTGYVKVTYH